MEVLAAVFGSLFFAFLSSMVGKSKGFGSASCFLAGLLLGPLALVWFLVKPKNDAALTTAAIRSGDFRKCPFCAELVRYEATVCKHCQRDLPKVKPPSFSENVAAYVPFSPQVAAVVIVFVGICAAILYVVIFQPLTPMVTENVQPAESAALNSWNAAKPLYVLLGFENECTVSETGVFAAPWGNSVPESRQRTEVSPDGTWMMQYTVDGVGKIEERIQYFKTEIDCRKVANGT